jgi:predicted nucleic acid-binding protein
MTVRTIVDTGPLVSFFHKTDTHHDWARGALANVPAPLLTCEAVVSEVCFLLSAADTSPAPIFDLIARGLITVDFSLATELDPVRRLMARYQDIGISLADACLVRMSETQPRCQVMTTDRDFLVYRREGRKTIPLLAPFEA